MFVMKSGGMMSLNHGMGANLPNRMRIRCVDF